MLKIKIRDSKSVVFEGEVERLSSFNQVGPFDVLPMHANFITLINREITLFHNREKIKELKIDQAIMKVKQNNVHIFIGIESFYLND